MPKMFFLIFLILQRTGTFMQTGRFQEEFLLFKACLQILESSAAYV